LSDITSKLRRFTLDKIVHDLIVPGAGLTNRD
jgi:hypothetical protein